MNLQMNSTSATKLKLKSLILSRERERYLVNFKDYNNPITEAKNNCHRGF